MSKDSLAQIRIIQISDIHFGSKNIALPEDKEYSARGYPDLANLVSDDLNSCYWNAHPWVDGRLGNSIAPIVIAATGDFTETAAQREFDQAASFLRAIANTNIRGSAIGMDSIYLVPGNHDVAFNDNNPAHRFSAYCTFYNDVFHEIQASGNRPIARPGDINSLTIIHKNPQARTIIAEINCCHYVERNTIDESRGQVDQNSIANLRNQLESLDVVERNWLKIALLHHHPILIPNFIEPGRSVDSIANSRNLLRLLREYGFHAILHGHKHYPHVFTYDPEPAWSTRTAPAQLVVAGGSLGSRGLPTGARSTNTYNFITIKWDWESRLARAIVVTRGLSRIVDDGENDPDRWSWETLRVYDRVLSGGDRLPSPDTSSTSAFPSEPDALEVERVGQYASQRGNMPVVEVIPSTLPGQGYEARVWVVQHTKSEIPVRVTWSAGKMFSRKTLDLDGSPRFCTSFNYWGPTLVQAAMEFSDGHKASAFVYARVPQR